MGCLATGAKGLTGVAIVAGTGGIIFGIDGGGVFGRGAIELGGTTGTAPKEVLAQRKIKMQINDLNITSNF